MPSDGYSAYVLPTMSYALILGLVAACAVLLVLESRGLRTTLALHFKGDIKRESRWFAQYGQFACTVVAAALVLRLDPRICQSSHAGNGAHRPGNFARGDGDQTAREPGEARP